MSTITQPCEKIQLSGRLDAVEVSVMYGMKQIGVLHNLDVFIHKQYISMQT